MFLIDLQIYNRQGSKQLNFLPSINCILFPIDVFCSTLFDPTNGHITFLVDPSTLVLTATYACDPGYGLSIGDMIRTCLELGWSGAEPVCEGMTAALLTCVLPIKHSCTY